MPSTAEPAASRSLLLAFLLRTHGVFEVSAVESVAISAVVRGLLGRLLLDAVGLCLLGRSLRDFVVVVGLDVLLCERSHGQ